ncbi:MAG: MarR family transcriptional regulator [Anaerolineales bacterium]
MKNSAHNLIHIARESGLSRSQLGTLFHLFHTGSTGVTDLGNHLGVTSAATSQMLDRLVQQGLILRSEDPTDRRVKQIDLTDKGLQIIHNCIQARQSWLLDLADTLSAHEKEQIARGLNILIEKTNQLESPVAPQS